MKLPQEDLLLPVVAKYLAKKLNIPIPNCEISSYTTEDLLNLHKENPEVVSFLSARCYLLDNFSYNFYTEKIFECLLDEYKPLRGYFFKCKADCLPKDFTFIRWKSLFFYPLFFGNMQDLFLSLWKREVSFVSFYTEISTIPELSEIAPHLEVITTLGFSRLTKRAEEQLSPVLRLQKKWLSLKEKEEVSELLFLVSSASLDEELSEGVLLKEEGREFYYVVRNSQSSFLEESLAKDLPQGAVLGIVHGSKLENPPFSYFSPLLLALSAYEHAKRAGLKFKEVDGFSLHVLADIIYELEDLGFAKRVYEVAKDYTLQPLELTLSLASIYYTIEDLDTAEKLLRSKLCGCVREDPMVHHNLGLVYLSKGNPSYAEYHLYKAYLLDPENKTIRERLIQFLFDQGRISDILEILAGKDDLSPQEALILGKIYFREKDYEKALSLLSQLLASPERDGEASLYLAWLYLNLRKNEEVAKVFLEEARNKLSAEEFERIRGDLNL